MLGIVSIAPNVGRPSRHSLRRRLRGAGVAGVKTEAPFGRGLGEGRWLEKLAAPHHLEQINIYSGRDAAAEKRHQGPAQHVRPSGSTNGRPNSAARWTFLFGTS